MNGKTNNLNDLTSEELDNIKVATFTTPNKYSKHQVIFKLKDSEYKKLRVLCSLENTSMQSFLPALVMKFVDKNLEKHFNQSN